MFLTKLHQFEFLVNQSLFSGQKHACFVKLPSLRRLRTWAQVNIYIYNFGNQINSKYRRPIIKHFRGILFGSNGTAKEAAT